MIFNMVWERNTGLMEQFSEGISIEAKRKTAGFSGPMEVVTKGILCRINFKGEASSPGRTKDCTKVNGKTT